ncbi:MAG: hypothetical protein QMC80_01510 [Thermoplasmatales archaeon]|nr:hypothetical protein [Thermoplasmatales archaeon]
MKTKKFAIGVIVILIIVWGLAVPLAFLGGEEQQGMTFYEFQSGPTHFPTYYYSHMDEEIIIVDTISNISSPYKNIYGEDVIIIEFESTEGKDVSLPSMCCTGNLTNLTKRLHEGDKVIVKFTGNEWIYGGYMIVIPEDRIQRVSVSHAINLLPIYVALCITVVILIVAVVLGYKRAVPSSRMYRQPRYLQPTTVEQTAKQVPQQPQQPQTVQVQCMNCGQINTILPGQESFICIRCGVKSVKK